MKVYFVFSVICIVGTYANPIKISDNPDVLECARKSNIDIVALEKLVEDKSYKPPADYPVPKEYYCFMSCMDHKKGGEWTYYEEYMKLIKQADQENYYFNDKRYTRQDLENTLNKCKSRGLDECSFLECIKYAESPFFKLFLYSG